MKNKIFCIITLLPMVVTAIVLKFMPDKIPMHYNAAGEIDRWGSKYEQFIFPVMILVFGVSFYLYIRHLQKKSVDGKTDKIRQEAANNHKVVYWTFLGLLVMYNIMHYSFLYSAYLEASLGATHMKFDTMMVTTFLMGIFLVVIGNIIPKAKRNSTVGMRTGWSVHNDMTWATSNRFAGKAFVVAGIIIAIQALIFEGLAAIGIMLGIIVLVSIVSIVYSYKMYKKYKDYKG